MTTTAKTLVLILLSIVAVYILLGFLPHLVQTLRRQILLLSVRSDKRRSNVVDSFLKEERPGRYFVAMIVAGLLRTIKTINHGAEFPDDKQLETFKRYGTQVIRNALDEIGEGV